MVQNLKIFFHPFFITSSFVKSLKNTFFLQPFKLVGIKSNMSEAGPCRYWITKGSCFFGDECKFAHPGDTAGEANSTSSEASTFPPASQDKKSSLSAGSASFSLPSSKS